MSNQLDKNYQALLHDILDNGVKKADRTGTGTLSVFGRQIRHKMAAGFPALTTKKLAFKTMVTELLWFLKGETNIKYLVDNGCHIWDGDCYKNYITVETDRTEKTGQTWVPLTQMEFIDRIKTDDEFATKWGYLGRIYGAQWREWIGFEQFEKYAETVYIDQIQTLIDDLKANPDSRRLMVSAWNPADLPNSVLPPCHYGFQVWTRALSFDERCDYAIKAGWMTEFGRFDVPETHYMLDYAKTPKHTISLMFNMRSNDVPLGLPFNIASYALLLEIIGRMVNMVPDELIASLGDAHIYQNQVDGIKEQLTREPYTLPQLKIDIGVDFNGSIDDFLNTCNKNSFSLNNYLHHPPIKIPLSN